MTDALDRIVPEDTQGRGLYRHDDEGSDDMPVGNRNHLVERWQRGAGGWQDRSWMMLRDASLGTRQVSLDRRQRHDSHYQWPVEHGHVARDLLHGVQRGEAHAQGGGYATGREDVESIISDQCNNNQPRHFW